ncbi:MAG: enoyl-CoA hydratase [Proteobacteria bacterium]|nr:MAG: enoyl-CoA hydratase [Pseudomonadota bacterium]
MNTETTLDTGTDKLTLTLTGHTATLVINNPPANTWDEESLPALSRTISALDNNKDIYALVVTGQGDRFFSAGADLKLFADGDKARARKMARLFGQAFETLGKYKGVSIAAINGYAMGGGLECALACDLRIVEKQAILALPEATVGLLPCAGGTQNLPWLVGEGWAKRMILCGERVSAEKAVTIGLAEEAVDTGEALNKAVEIAARVARQSPSSVEVCKRLLMAARSNPMQHALPLERELFVDLFDTQDQKEGVNAFLEKRQAHWKNG